MSENGTDGEDRPTREGEGFDERIERERPSDESRGTEGEGWRVPEDPDGDIVVPDDGGGGGAGAGSRGDEDLPPPEPTEPPGPADLSGDDDGEQPH